MTKDICVTVDEWKKKRQRTFISYCVMTSIIGLEYGIFPATILSYLQEGLHAENADLWFGMITASYFISSIICCLVITRYTDRTRNVKKTLIISCIFVAFGNFLYSIPSYAFVILIARLIQGIADSLLPIIQGEIIRFYEEEERLHKLSIVTMCYYMSYIGGPVVTTIFSGVDFEIFGARFKVYNFPFLLVGFLWATFVLVILFFVSDLSKENRKIKEYFENNNEPDLFKQNSNIKNRNREMPPQDPSSSSSKEMPPLTSTTSLFNDNRVNFVLLLAYVCGYFAGSFNVVQLPLISKELYQIPVHYLGMIFNLEAVTFGVTLYVLNKVKDENKVVYFIIFAMCSMIIGLQAMALSALFYSYRTLGICLILTFAVCVGVGWSSEQVFLVVLLGRIVPSEIQGFAAGVRRTMTSLSYVSGALFAALLHDFIFEHIFVYSVVVFLLIFIFLYIRNKFISL